MNESTEEINTKETLPDLNGSDNQAEPETSPTGAPTVTNEAETVDLLSKEEIDVEPQVHRVWSNHPLWIITEYLLAAFCFALYLILPGDPFHKTILYLPLVIYGVLMIWLYQIPKETNGLNKCDLLADCKSYLYATLLTPLAVVALIPIVYYMFNLPQALIASNPLEYIPNYYLGLLYSTPALVFILHVLIQPRLKLISRKLLPQAILIGILYSLSLSFLSIPLLSLAGFVIGLVGTLIYAQHPNYWYANVFYYLNGLLIWFLNGIWI